MSHRAPGPCSAGAIIKQVAGRILSRLGQLGELGCELSLPKWLGETGERGRNAFGLSITERRVWPEGAWCYGDLIKAWSAAL